MKLILWIGTFIGLYVGLVLGSGLGSQGPLVRTEFDPQKTDAELVHAKDPHASEEEIRELKREKKPRASKRVKFADKNDYRIISNRKDRKDNSFSYEDQVEVKLNQSKGQDEPKDQKSKTEDENTKTEQQAAPKANDNKAISNHPNISLSVLIIVICTFFI